MRCRRRVLVGSLLFISITSLFLQMTIRMGVFRSGDVKDIMELTEVQALTGIVNGNVQLNGASGTMLGGNTVNDRQETLELPGIATYLPHLKNHPEYLQPMMRVSRNRSNVSLVIGVPTIKRPDASYLDETLKSLFVNLPAHDATKCLIIVFIAEPWDVEYVKQITIDLELMYPNEISSGLLEIIAPSPKFYPALENLKLTFNDDSERVKWRTKQNLDYAYLMMHSTKRGKYYIQLEDDIITKPDYFSFIMRAIDSRSTAWIVLRFSALGFIGKLFRTTDLPLLVEFLLMFYADKPGDWLLDNVLTTKLCGKDMHLKECQLVVSKVAIDVKPPLFQHIGYHSSLKGKIQKLKEKTFKAKTADPKNKVFQGNHNPPASYLNTSISHYEDYDLEQAYKGYKPFWGYTPVAGDIIDIVYNPPIKIYSYKLVSGSGEHPDDIFPESTTVLVEPVFKSGFQNGSQGDEMFYQVGTFDKSGIARNIIPPSIDKIKTFRIKVNETMTTWILLREILIGDSATPTT